MSRPAPRPVPKVMPSMATACEFIEKYLNAPRMRLGDLSIRQLVDTYSTGPVWLTGSTVWMTAVFDEPPPPDNDIDLIFGDPYDCNRFVQRVMGELNRRAPGYEYKPATSAFGAQKILFPEPPKPLLEAEVTAVPTGPNLYWNGPWRHCKLSSQSTAERNKDRGVLDAWPLEPGESVGEVLMSYQHDHQRCAYSMARSIAGNPAALTRIVRAAPRPMADRY